MNTQTNLIFERQGFHVIALLLLLIGAYFATKIEGMQEGSLWGVNSIYWFWMAVLIPVLHQVYVWFCWRTQLHANFLTRVFGEKDFMVFTAGFSVFGTARVAAVIILAISNQGTLPINRAILVILAIATLLPALYLFYSVKRYFGFKRALGIDHFDERYRHLPLVSEGIFRYTSNGMYVFGFLLLWSIAFWYGSTAALIAALFNHTYIWVHYYATELPDMKRIYG